ncbi:hypothetical protein ABS71_12520 [bacterium SCN 62-11]|nr:MAG: hypothetical protein ABS71_12520 [bacterium SCN 62-11]
MLEQFQSHLAQGNEDFEVQSAFGKTRIVNHPGRAEQILQSEAYQRTSLLTMALGQGLLASDGELWSKQRQKLSPHFGGQLLRDFELHTLKALDSRLARWDQLAGSGQTWEAGEDLSRLTLDVAAGALLSLEGPDLDPVSGAVTEVVTGLGKISATIFAADLNLDPQYLQRLRDSIATLDRFAYQLIERRTQQPLAGYDLLSRLLEGGDLPPVLVRDEIVTALISGHETTSQVVCWALMLLCQHPDVYQLAQAEARSQGADGRLPLIQAILHETMRLYPPVWYMGRRSGQETVVVSPWLIHRHPHHWERPLDFLPQRFLDSAPSSRIYLPFGTGRHVCLGRRQALREGSLILAALLGRYQMRPRNDPRPQGHLTLRHWPPLEMELSL